MYAFMALLVVLTVPARSQAGGPPLAQPGGPSRASDPTTTNGHGHHHGEPAAPGAPKWEGSPEGVAYSERNHHLAGWFVLVMALTELREALAWTRLPWSRFLLPAAMLGAGVFLLIWSDHEAWPIGSLSVTDTFFGHDHEMLQHKLYGVLLLAVGTIESLRRAGRLAHRAWLAPLPIFAIIGGLMLFVHSHGDHPSAHKIALHHAAMGVMAVAAGSCKLVSAGTGVRSDRSAVSRWEVAWAGLILLIGVQLLLYSE